MKTLPDDLDLIAEHIGDDQPSLPPGAKNTLLLAAKTLRKLPTTADGVAVVPYVDTVYSISGIPVIITSTKKEIASKYYSTREAADAARREMMRLAGSKDNT